MFDHKTRKKVYVQEEREEKSDNISFQETEKDDTIGFFFSENTLKKFAWEVKE